MACLLSWLRSSCTRLRRSPPPKRHDLHWISFRNNAYSAAQRNGRILHAEDYRLSACYYADPAMTGVLQSKFDYYREKAESIMKFVQGKVEEWIHANRPLPKGLNEQRAPLFLEEALAKVLDLYKLDLEAWDDASRAFERNEASRLQEANYIKREEAVLVAQERFNAFYREWEKRKERFNPMKFLMRFDLKEQFPTEEEWNDGIGGFWGAQEPGFPPCIWWYLGFPEEEEWYRELVYS